VGRVKIFYTHGMLDCRGGRFNTTFLPQLSSVMSREEFDAMISGCNDINLQYNTSCLNWGCLLPPCCLCVSGYRHNKGMAEIRKFLRAECKRSWTDRNVLWRLIETTITATEDDRFGSKDKNIWIQIDYNPSAPKNVVVINKIHITVPSESQPLLD